MVLNYIKDRKSSIVLFLFVTFAYKYHSIRISFLITILIIVMAFGLVFKDKKDKDAENHKVLTNVLSILGWLSPIPNDIV